MNLLPGTILGQRYRIDALLGEGGMGAVYRATDWRGAGCALKVLRPECLASADLQRRFDQEARIGMQLRHPNIRQIWDCGVDPRTHLPYLAMELLLGEDLAGRLAWRGFLGTEELGPLLAQLCDALGSAHGTGIVHRDLKPENLFLAATAGGAEVLKVLDFGIAKVLAGQSHANSTVIGTPSWMAPEQLGVDADIGPATDVWAVGLLAFFVLTGRSYWPTANDSSASFGPIIVEILDAARHVPASVRAQRYGCPERIPPGGFDAWFAACIAIHPQGRHRDAPACWAALRNVLSGALANASTSAMTPFGRTMPVLIEEDPMVEQVIAELRQRMPAALAAAAATPDIAVASDPHAPSRPGAPGSGPRASDPGAYVRGSTPGSRPRHSDPGVRGSTPGSRPRTSDPGAYVRGSTPGSGPRASDPGAYVHGGAPGGAYASGSLPGTPAGAAPRGRIPLIKRITPTPPVASAHPQLPFAPQSPSTPQSPFAPPAVAQPLVHTPRAPHHAARAWHPQTWLIPAGKGLRLGANLVDRVIASVAGVVLGALWADGQKTRLWIGLLVIFFVAYLLRDVLGGGRSLGKRLFNLEIVDADNGAPAGIADAFTRQFLSLDGMPVVNLVGIFIDGVLVLARDDGRRTGDLLSGTQVVQRVSQ